MTTQEVIQSNRPGDVTTIWRDGEVIRCDAWGRCKALRSVSTVGETTDQIAKSTDSKNAA